MHEHYGLKIIALTNCIWKNEPWEVIGIINVVVKIYTSKIILFNVKFTSVILYNKKHHSKD